MYKLPTREEVQYWRDQYPAGTRVKLIAMDDPQAVPSGTMGTIFYVDAVAQLHVNWDNGRKLALVIGQDQWERVPEQEMVQEEPTAPTMGGQSM